MLENFFNYEIRKIPMFKDRNGNKLPAIPVEKLKKFRLVNGNVIRYNKLTEYSNNFRSTVDIECGCGNVFRRKYKFYIENWGENTRHTRETCPRCQSDGYVDHMIDIQKDFKYIYTTYKINVR